jgi:hypothetical protein
MKLKVGDVLVNKTNKVDNVIITFIKINKLLVRKINTTVRYIVTRQFLISNYLKLEVLNERNKKQKSNPVQKNNKIRSHWKTRRPTKTDA